LQYASRKTFNQRRNNEIEKAKQGAVVHKFKPITLAIMCNTSDPSGRRNCAVYDHKQKPGDVILLYHDMK